MGRPLTQLERAMLEHVERHGHVLRVLGNVKESARRQRMQLRGLLEYVPDRVDCVRLTDAGRAALTIARGDTTTEGGSRGE